MFERQLKRCHWGIFHMALGVGVASIRSDEQAHTDSFGLVALCSVGPILAVLLLSFVYRDAPQGAAASIVSNYADTVALGHGYLHALPVSQVAGLRQKVSIEDEEPEAADETEA